MAYRGTQYVSIVDDEKVDLLNQFGHRVNIDKIEWGPLVTLNVLSGAYYGTDNQCDHTGKVARIRCWGNVISSCFPYVVTVYSSLSSRVRDH